MNNQRSVAIVGAGPAGLIFARWALRCRMLPTLFESASSVGGLWRKHDTTSSDVQSYRWPSNRGNVSRYAFELFGFPLPKDTDMIPSREQIAAYLQSYAEHFGILPHVRFGHRVLAVEPLDADLSETRWTLRFLDMSKTEHSEVFDCMVLASGVNAKPHIPQAFKQLLQDTKCCFRGKVFHTPTDAPLDRPVYAAQNVVLVGSSHSAIDMLAHISGNEEAALNARHVVLLRRRHHWNVPQFISTSTLQTTGQCSNNSLCQNGHQAANTTIRFPADLIFFRRCMRQQEAEILIPSEEMDLKMHHLMETLFPEHNKMANQKFALIPEVHYKHPVFIAIANDDFCQNVERIGERLEVIDNDEIIEMEDKSFRFASGKIVPCDILLFATGYESTVQNMLPSRILEVLEYRESPTLHPVIMNKNTLHPRLHTLAFIYQQASLFYTVELQARWAASVFSGRLPPSDPSDVRVQDYLSELRKARDLPFERRPLYGHSDISGFADELAREVGSMPDISRAQKEDPELYSLLRNVPCFWAHYFLDGPDADRETSLAALRSFAQAFPKF